MGNFILPLSLLSLSLEKSYVVLPLKKYVLHSRNDNVTYKFYNEFVFPSIFANISATEDSDMALPAFLNSREKGFYLKSSPCPLVSYNFLLSHTSRTIPKERFEYRQFGDCFLTHESFRLFADASLSGKKVVRNVTFVFTGKVQEKKCANLGLKYRESYLDKSPDLLSELKRNGGVERLVWVLDFNGENEGKLIMGAFPHEYDPSHYKEEDFMQIGVTQTVLNDLWYITFTDVYMGDHELPNGLKAEVYPEFGLISGTKEYFDRAEETFFNEFFWNDTCRKDNISIYTIYSCDKRKFNEKNIKNFPGLNFFHLTFRFNFSFNPEELFMEYEDRIFFKIIQNRHFEHEWTIGKIFLQKYKFVFNPDGRSLGFYLPLAPPSRSAFIALILFLVLFVLGAALSGYSWSRICFFRRRVFASELEEEGIREGEREDREKKLVV